MRFNPDFPPDGHQAVAVDRAVTLLMPAGLDAGQFDAGQFDLGHAAAGSPAFTPPNERSDSTPGLVARLVGFLLRPN